MTTSSNPDARVRVTCGNGRVYEADHAIVTVSLGVLKKKILPRKSFFKFGLPEEKIKVRLDSLRKHYIHYA